MPARSKPRSRRATPASPSPAARTARPARAARGAAPKPPTKPTKPAKPAKRAKRTARPAAAPSPPPDAHAATPPHGLITSTANGGNRGAKVDMQAVYQAVIHGLLLYYQPNDVFQMQAGTFTRDELIAEFQEFVKAAQATKSSNQQWRADIQHERVVELHVRGLRRGVRGITQARFGPQGAQNLQFGYTLVKPRRRSAETTAIAVQKSLATRSKRGTMGRVQKKDVKGDVHVALVVTPAEGEASRSGKGDSDGARGAEAPPVLTVVASPPVAVTSDGTTGAATPATRTPPSAPDGH
jgi:hypothetical protein